MWVVLTPILLFLLLSVLIYVPPVQKWAVDKACTVLSEEMGMDVTVESVRLKFPLDLSMGGMSAVQNGDTLVAARSLEVSVRLKPLFDGKAEVDGVRLLDTRLNTGDMVEACSIKGHVGEISLDSHSTDICNELAVVNKALVSDADLFVVLNDSVPEDTTESEPLTWKVQIDDAELRNVKARIMLPPTADSTYVSASIASAHAKAFLDLGTSEYRIDSFCIDDADVGHTMFAQNGMKDLHIVNVKGSALMDSLSLSIPKVDLQTKDSKIALSYRMDMNAFADTLPGTFTVATDAQIGKDDILYFAKLAGESSKDICATINQWIPAQATQLSVKAEGNLEALDVSTLHAHVPGLATLDADAKVWDAVKDLSLETNAKALLGKAATVDLKAGFVMAQEAYRADVKFKNIVVNDFVKMDERAVFSGEVSANGHGFDFLNAGTILNAKADLRNSHFGKINLSNIIADAKLQGNKINLDLDCDNDQLRTTFTLDGSLRKNLLAGKLNIDLPFLDAQAMGFSEDVLQASTSGIFDFTYNLDKLFRLESNVSALSLLLGENNITTDAFYLYAETKKDSTAACLQTGDLDFDFHMPHNPIDLMPQIDKLSRAFNAQAKKRQIDINILKTYIPELHLHATAGKQNPVSQILATYGIKFNEFVADVEASPVEGLSGNGHVYRFSTDSIVVDTAYFVMNQDSTKFDYEAGVSCREQAQLPAFRALVNGYLGMTDADVHLTYLNKRNEKGIDIGMKAVGEDSCISMKFYPEQPIIAFRKFKLNNDNYVQLRKDRPVLADVKLRSVIDSTYVTLLAYENGAAEQEAAAIIRNLNIKEVLSVLPIPGLPNMGGLFNVDATYYDKGEGFSVAGDASLKRFVFENMLVGDIGSQYKYTPIGTTAHNIDATMSYNGTDVVKVDGTYEAVGDGSLNANVDILDVPMQMVSPFIPDQIVALTGYMAGNIKVNGPVDKFLVNGALVTKDMHINANQYSVDLRLENDSIRFDNSRALFDAFKIHGAGKNPLTLNGYVDFADFNNMLLSLSLYGRDFKLVESKRAKKKVLFGDMYGDFFARVNGSSSNLTVRGLINVLPTTDITYIMTETPLSQGDRLDDIVTFIDFSMPPDTTSERESKQFMGIDMNMVLSIEDGAQFHCEFSSDKQSYVNVQGGGSITMSYTPEGVLNLQGRYTVNEGEMKYTLPVIPLKTFTLHNGSYIEFTGNPMNPTLNVAATERTRATVGQEDGTSRSVAFDVGLKITNTLNNMGLEFTIEAPEDLSVQNELASASAEEKNKLAVALLATGMYLSSSNSKGFTASNALNNFLQNEINNIAGKALNTMVNVDVGMEQTTRDDGTTRTDYSFQFSRRFFSDRLNVVIGGKVSADGNTEANESGAYIDDVSLEWRLDNGGAQYVRLFHEKDYSNLIEGELDKNGAGVLLRKKVDKFSDLFLWLRKKENE